MRKNTQEVFKAWTEGKAQRKQDSIWTDGQVIFSYGTWLFKHQQFTRGKSKGLVKLGKYEFNNTRYSITTSIQQGGLKTLVMTWLNGDVAYDMQVREVEDVPMGSR